MSLPNDVAAGEFLSASWLNQVKAEVQKNEIVSSRGVSFNRSTNGTTLSTSFPIGSIPFSGVVETAINDTGNDYEQWWFAGIKEVTNRTEMENNVSDGVQLMLRQPEAGDLYGRLVMLAEPIAYGEAGKVYISSDLMITRIKFAQDGSEDEYEYATIDTDADGSSEDAYLLQAASIGPVQIIDVDPDASETWRWAIIRFPIADSIPAICAEATSAPNAEGEFTVKRFDREGVLSEDELTVYDGGIGLDSELTQPGEGDKVIVTTGTDGLPIGVRIPLMAPLFAEATSAPSGGTLTIKLANSDGTLVGSDITVYDGGIV